jgi:hypothetical protein
MFKVGFQVMSILLFFYTNAVQSALLNYSIVI